ncbi:MAG: site-2 protease family protein, partial [Patescibacteria group bacterium]
GPVGIAVLTGQAARMGLVYLLQFTALLSLNLAIINIIPFPALDGGRLLFLLIEKIRGKVMDQRWENTANNVGFMLLMLLIILVTFKDVWKYGGALVNVFRGMVGI